MKDLRKEILRGMKLNRKQLGNRREVFERMSEKKEVEARKTTTVIKEDEEHEEDKG